MKVAGTIFLIALSVSSVAQTLTRGEYFFDTDPGKGNGTSLSFTAAASINKTFSIDISSLATGVHTFNARFVDSNGRWSLFNSKTFVIVSASAEVTAAALKRAEYFFDNDPGTGKATALSITSGNPQNNSFNIGIGTLTNGFHQLAIRYQDNQDRWSFFANRTFYIVTPATTAASTSIKKAEYFFDNDPGVGLGKSLAITAGSPQNNLFTIPISSLTSGFHQLAIRYQDNVGKWSLFANRTFYIVPTPSVALATSIKKAEYFFDNDPGIGLGKSLSITAGNPQNNLFHIDISSLTSGFHQLAIRYQDNNGRWSVFTNRTFYIVPAPNVASATALTKAEYFFDHDPGAGNGKTLTISPGNPQNNLLPIDISSLASGFHQIGIRYVDNQHRWSNFTTRTFYVIPGTVVSKTIERLEYFIGKDPGYGSGNPVAITQAATINQPFAIDLTGMSSGNDTLRVRVRDSQGYWSTIISTPFTIQNCTPPAAPSVPSVTQCNSGSSLLTANGASSSQVYHWYANDTTLALSFVGASYTTPTINKTTTFYSSVYDPNTKCESNRTVATVMVTNIPKPTLNLTGSLTVCSGNAEILIAPSSFATYSWSNGITGKDTIHVSTTGNYTVTVGDGTCTSPPSDPFAFTVNPTPAKPIISATSGGTLCGGGTVTLTASTGPGYTYSWSSGQTVNPLIVNSPGDFYVTISDANGCQSTPSNVFTVTTSAPAKPVIVVSGNPILCDTTSVKLSAPPGFSKYVWSSGDTTQTIRKKTQGNYSVSVSNGSCSSPASDPTSVSLVTTPVQPTIQLTGTTALCNNSFVGLSAPIGYSVYLWSDNETARQITIGQAGSYSVQIGNALNCLSVPSPAVNVTSSTIPAKPVIMVTGNPILCDTTSVKLSAPPGFSKYVWSSGDTTQMVKKNIAGSYSVSVSNGSCASQASDAVVVSVVTTPLQPTITLTGTSVLCNNSFVGMSAPTGYGVYVWSDLEASRQIVVSQAGSYTVQVGNAINCLSVPSTAIQVTLSGQPCGGVPNPNNTPPSIGAATLNLAVGDSIRFDLKSIIKKGTTGVDFSTLRVAQAPPSGASAVIDANYNLFLNYAGNTFVGNENVSIQVCDSLSNCTERAIEIDVSANVIVFNAVSPFPDGINDFFNLKYIDQMEATKSNTVIIVDRWGNQVFSISDYNNSDRVFKGNDNSGKELPSGTYYYRIDFASGRPTLTGFISLKR